MESNPFGADPRGDDEVVMGVFVGGQVAGVIGLVAIQESDASLNDGQAANDAVLGLFHLLLALVELCL